ncbi:MAG: SpoIID/LytB domain-containing protein [bacterium]|nr:SpoIID/LytB domain-containing protein [bacterium]
MSEPKLNKYSRLIRLSARLGTGLMLMALVFSCARVPGLRDEAKGSFIRVPFVRVLLDEDSSSKKVKADGPLAIECLSGGVQEVFYSNRDVVIKNDHNRLKVVSGAGAEIQADLDEINIIPRGNGNHILVGGKSYRGIIKFLPYGQNLQIINIVYMEDYLRGVVPPEIGRRSEAELESVKAQAVAARTYAMAHLQQYPNAPYDMKSSIIDQVYEGFAVENKIVNRAINETSGHVATFQDEFINAYYHSTCGGMTDAVEHVWDRKEAAYLKAVADSGACSWSKYYNWTEVFSEEQLRGRIEQYLSSDRGRDLRIGRIEDVIIGNRTPGGRIAQLSVRTQNDIFKFSADRIRWVIGRTSNPDLILPSDRFDVQLNRDQSGSIRKITFKGSGYGHGVGMCQCGAIGLSREGWLFADILKHYYSGIDVKKLY